MVGNYIWFHEMLCTVILEYYRTSKVQNYSYWYSIVIKLIIREVILKTIYDMYVVWYVCTCVCLQVCIPMFKPVEARRLDDMSFYIMLHITFENMVSSRTRSIPFRPRWWTDKLPGSTRLCPQSWYSRYTWPCLASMSALEM